MSNRAAAAGIVVLGILVIVSLTVSFLPIANPLTQSSKPLLAPTWAHPFGTDELGRDLLARVLFGTRAALETAFGAAAFAALIGVPVGLISGYRQGWIDAVFMRLIDFVLSVPGIVFALVIVAVLGPGQFKLIIAIGIVSVPAFARLARASTLSVKQRDYVLAARSMGARQGDIMFRTVLPNIIDPIIVQAIVTASVAILIAAALDFLGLGPAPPAPTWGGMLQTSVSYLYQSPWYGIFPGFALALTIGALDGIGKGLQTAFGAGGSASMKSGAFA